MTYPRLAPELVARIAQAALDPARWVGVLELVAHTMQCRTAALYVVDETSGRGEILASFNWSADPVRRARLIWRLSAVTREGEIYFDAFAPACDGVLVLPLVDAGGRAIGAWCVTEPLEGGQLNAEIIEVARAITPHILQTVRAASEGERQRTHAVVFQTAFDALAAGAFLVDARGTIVFRNAAAAAELAEGCLFRERNGRLVGLTPAASAIAMRIASLRSTALQGGDAEITAPDGRNVQVSWATLPGTAARLVVVQRADIDLDAAAQRFKLTTAEAQVLAELLEGVTLSEAADNLGIARSTVKSHLAAIFRKSDTRRRAELVRRTLGLRPQLRC